LWRLLVTYAKLNTRTNLHASRIVIKVTVVVFLVALFHGFLWSWVASFVDIVVRTISPVCVKKSCQNRTIKKKLTAQADRVDKHIGGVIGHIIINNDIIIYYRYYSFSRSGRRRDVRVCKTRRRHEKKIYRAETSAYHTTTHRSR